MAGHKTHLRMVRYCFRDTVSTGLPENGSSPADSPILAAGSERVVDMVYVACAGFLAVIAGYRQGDG